MRRVIAIALQLGEDDGFKELSSLLPRNIMLIFDAHLDLAWNAIDWNRDLTGSIGEIRQRERGMSGVARGANTVSFGEMRRGEIGLCIATLLARALRPTTPPIQRYATMEAAYASAFGQIAYYRAMTERGVLRWIRDA